MKGHVVRSVNPYNEQLLLEIEEYSDNKLEEILARAETAFHSWKRTDFPQRIELLSNCSRLLLENKETLAKTITQEMGKILVESLAEVEKCAWVCRYYAENGEGFLNDHPLTPEGAHAMISYEPLGVILAVMPWNFPFWQVFRFAAPALMAGNCGLLKHASNVPQCSLAIEKIFREAGAPEGIFQSVIMNASRVSRLISDGRIKAATLTGSESAGSEVAAIAGKNIKKTVLELGGSDPFMVLPDADIDLAAEVGIKARMINCGQSCIAAKRFILHKEISDSFIEKFKTGIGGLKMGDPMVAGTDYGPMAREDLAADLEKQLGHSLERGATLAPEGAVERNKAFFKASLLKDVKPGMSAFDEEIFGPVAALIVADDEKELIELANKSRFGLGASLWTGDLEKGLKLARQIESGSVFINKMVASHPAIPFGGIKLSGYGRELSHLGIREFVNAKSIVY